MDPNIHEAHRRDRRYRRLPAVILLAIIALAGAAWLGLFGFLGSNAALGTVEDLETRYVCDVGEFDLSLPAVSSLSEVYTSDRVLLGKLSERNSQPVALDDIPEEVIGALLSAEDKGFYEHEGVNFTAIARAAAARTGGASTITQQVVKQNFLNADRTIERKICEALIATELEEIYTKDQILEFYINSVFFGSNAYGIQAAAQEYFEVPLDELTVAQSATIVTIIRNPTFYHPRKNPSESLRARTKT
jgi:membrane peptidoglycan carboxypeptidase